MINLIDRSRFMYYKDGMDGLKSNISYITQFISLSQAQKEILFVFDIDSTLYNVSPRNVEIIKDFAKRSELPKDLQTSLLKVTALPTDWGIKTPLLRLALPNITEQLIRDIKKHWNQFFFGGDFLHHDQEYPGAIEFVNQLSKNAPTFYLTGRDIYRMGDATLKQLKNSGFPTDPEHNRLILKPDMRLLDHEYKISELKALAAQYKKIYFFENEPVILNEVIKQFPKDSVIPICIDSTHSGRALIDRSIIVIPPDYQLKD